MPAQLNTVYVLHSRDDVIVTAVRHQTTSHARGRGDTIRTVLGILRADSRVREMVGRHLTAVNVSELYYIARAIGYTLAITPVNIRNYSFIITQLPEKENEIL